MNGFDISTITGLYVGSTPYSAIYKGSSLIWSAGPHDYSKDYFTIESLEDNNAISINGALGSGSPASYDTVATWYYSTDKVNWTEFNVRNSTKVYNPNFITLNRNQKVYLKTTSQFYKTGITNTQDISTYQYNYFYTTKNFKVYGNIMSLCYGDNFVNQTTLPWTYTFYYLFKDCSKLVDVSNLILPATTLTNYCYDYMFNNCTALTTAPELPATTLANGCYFYMFYGCKSLTTAPELPATTLKGVCYMGMFSGCTSLTIAPELPATTLASQCYSSMFSGCTSLTTAPELLVTTLVQYCYQSMFYNCTSLTTAPELPATTLANNCYQSMFYRCTSLNYVKALFTTDISSTTDYTNNWLYNVAATGTFIKSADATWSRTDASGVPSGWTVVQLHDYSQDYFTIESLEDNNQISINNYANSPINQSDVRWDFEYSTDKTNWTSQQSYVGTPGTMNIITLNTGQKLYIRSTDKFAGKYTRTNGSNSTFYHYFVTTKNFKVYGNIMSLCYGDNFSNQTTLPWTYTFYYLFKICSKLIDASNLILPATTLESRCYQNMFNNCTALTTAPELPATTLANNCYQNMFQNCTALTTAPELPATTLANYCYYNMFYGCTSLTTAPELPATTLTEYCYQTMFQNCTSLTTAPELPATTLALYCYYSMFYGCTSLTTAPELPATTLVNCCYQYMFQKCTSLTTAPELPATTLTEYCYQNMFSGCTSLTTAPELPATTLVNYCYQNMFSGCTSLNYVKALFTTDISSTRSYTNNWLYNVAATGIFVKSADATWSRTDASGVPSGWTVQTASS